jgi:hypothetical protein
MSIFPAVFTAAKRFVTRTQGFCPKAAESAERVPTGSTTSVAKSAAITLFRKRRTSISAKAVLPEYSPNARRRMSKVFDRHHIIPRIVCLKLGIPPDFEGNLVRVKTNKHRAWHQLFGSATPDEAIEIITAEWSLSEQGSAEFKKLTNVRLFRRKKQ